MSKTFEMIMKHWTDKEVFQGEYGHLELPFDIEAFCAEMDELLNSLISIEEK